MSNVRATLVRLTWSILSADTQRDRVPVDQHVANSCSSPATDGPEVQHHRRDCKPQASYGPGGRI